MPEWDEHVDGSVTVRLFVGDVVPARCQNSHLSIAFFCDCTILRTCDRRQWACALGNYVDYSYDVQFRKNGKTELVNNLKVTGWHNQSNTLCIEFEEIAPRVAPAPDKRVMRKVQQKLDRDIRNVRAGKEGSSRWTGRAATWPSPEGYQTIKDVPHERVFGGNSVSTAEASLNRKHARGERLHSAFYCSSSTQHKWYRIALE